MLAPITDRYTQPQLAYIWQTTLSDDDTLSAQIIRGLVAENGILRNEFAYAQEEIDFVIANNVHNAQIMDWAEYRIDFLEAMGINREWLVTHFELRVRTSAVRGWVVYTAWFEPKGITS